MGTFKGPGSGWAARTLQPGPARWGLQNLTSVDAALQTVGPGELSHCNMRFESETDKMKSATFGAR